MRWLAAWAVMMLVGLPALWALDDEKDKPKEPAELTVAQEVDVIIMAHQKAVKDFLNDNQEKLKNAKTPEERAKINEGLPKADVPMGKLLDLLEKNPKDKEAAITASQWILNNSRGGGDEVQKARAKTLDLLIKHQADNPKIVAMLPGLVTTPSPKAEELLRAVLGKNPAKDVRGKADLYLGSYLKLVGEKVKAEAAFDDAITKYGDVVMSTNPKTKKNTTIADRAGPELFEMRNLAIGKPVPDIVAEDLDGKSFKLSEYKGKVVVLDFWGNW